MKKKETLPSENTTDGLEISKPKKKKTALIISVVLVSVCMVAGVVMVVVNAAKTVENQMAAMTEGGDDGTYKVERQDISQEIVSSGTVIGTAKTAYTSPVTAKVEKIQVEVGQTVKAGDVLLTYDASDLGDNLEKVKIQAQSEQAAGKAGYEAVNDAKDKAATADKKADKIKKQIKTAKSDIKATKAEIETLKQEVKTATQKVTAAQDKLEEDQMAGVEKPDKTALRNAQADLENKEEALAAKQEKLAEQQADLSVKEGKLTEQQAIISAGKEAKVSDSEKAQMNAANQLSNMNINDAQESYDAAEAGITAQASGIIASIEAVEGAYASETQTLLTIIDGDKIGVEFAVSKGDLRNITQGQKARVEISGRQYDGTVDFVSRVATSDVQFAGNSSEATIKGRITLDAPDDSIFIGVSAKVYIFVGESSQTLAVPYGALNTDVDGDYVYVVNKENLIERRDVTIGIYSDEYYEIIEGIAEGDRVITSVTKDMKPGDTYVPPVAMPTNMMGL